MSLTINLTDDEIRKRFNAIRSFGDLAVLLDIPKGMLYFYAHKTNLSKHYKVFDIPKKSGGVRRIYAPSSPLKIIQSKLNQILSAVYVPKASVHGFTMTRSIKTNAVMHVGGKAKRYVFNLDIQDFFPTITNRRIWGLLRATPYNLPPRIAQTIANLCCLNGQLPQGAPSSPVVSNMICGRMDTQFRRLASSSRCIYTRYADDITFSTTLSSFPHNIAKTIDSTGTIVVGDDVQDILDNNWFQVNTGKVRLQSKNKRQVITGLTVNRFPNVPRKFVREIRAMLHSLEVYGAKKAQDQYWAKYSPSGVEKNFIKVLRGKIEFLRFVRGDVNTNYIAFRDKLNFLDPNYVIPKAKIPSVVSTGVYIVTEGKSDWKHLKASLKRFQSNGKYVDLDIEFKEYGDELRMNDAELLKRTNSFITERPNKININIFDRDVPAIIKEVTTKGGEDYKEWTERLFTFALPRPSIRSGDEICMELYYSDADIMRSDRSGKRMFLSSEFDAKSQKHLKDIRLSCTNKNKFKGSKLSIIDADVYDDVHRNIALPKDDFAQHILNGVSGFEDVDIANFTLIFDMIRTIVLKHKSRLIGIPERTIPQDLYQKAKELLSSIWGAIKFGKNG